MKSLTREDIASLPVKPRLKRELRFVPEEISDWEDRDYIAVMNKVKTEGVLIAELEERFVAPFRLQKRAANSHGRVEAIICDFCATWQRGSNSMVISFQKEKGKRIIFSLRRLVMQLACTGQNRRSKAFQNPTAGNNLFRK